MVDALESVRVIGIGLNSDREPDHELDADAGVLCRHAASGAAACARMRIRIPVRVVGERLTANRELNRCRVRPSLDKVLMVGPVRHMT